MKARALNEARIEAQQILDALVGALISDSNLLTEDELDRIKTATGKLETALQTQDSRQIQELTAKLNAETAEFATRRMDKEIVRALRGEAISSVHDS